MVRVFCNAHHLLHDDAVLLKPASQKTKTEVIRGYRTGIATNSMLVDGFRLRQPVSNSEGN